MENVKTVAIILLCVMVYMLAHDLTQARDSAFRLIQINREIQSKLEYKLSKYE